MIRILLNHLTVLLDADIINLKSPVAVAVEFIYCYAPPFAEFTFYLAFCTVNLAKWFLIEF
jgi:hypothetical protein